MMKCEIVRDLIPMCVDKTASSDTMEAVKMHIDICRDCRKFYNSCRNAEYSLSEKGNTFPGNFFSQKGNDISGLDQQYAHFSRKLKTRRIKQIAVAALVLLGMVTYVVSDIVKIINKKRDTKR